MSDRIEEFRKRFQEKLRQRLALSKPVLEPITVPEHIHDQAEQWLLEEEGPPLQPFSFVLEDE